jgi:hypothetical protein
MFNFYHQHRPGDLHLIRQNLWLDILNRLVSNHRPIKSSKQRLPLERPCVGLAIALHDAVDIDDRYCEVHHQTIHYRMILVTISSQE